MTIDFQICREGEFMGKRQGGWFVMLQIISVRLDVSTARFQTKKEALIYRAELRERINKAATTALFSIGYDILNLLSPAPLAKGGH